ncbi:MAG: hypothetical protein M1831_000174 [Alyxoria varia]|nr:MAG: hypothetical protein M1831_000174 [Alyxoria varia]
MLQLPPRACRQLLQAGRRGYAVAHPGAPAGLQVFNRNTKWLQKERAAADVEASRRVDYLRDEVASRLCERLLDINRHFPQVLDLGANACNIARVLTQPPDTSTNADDPAPPNTAPISTRISNLTAADSSPTLLNRDASLPFNSSIPITREVLTDEEGALPYPDNTYDAVLSSLSLHWINNLPGTLREINRVLKPDAPIIAALLGGDSLFELRTSLQLADMDRRGGVSTHVSPLADVKDMGGLLQGAGFKLLTVDVDDIVVDYPSCFELMADLQAMGEGNAVIMRDGKPIGRDVLLACEGIYKELHGNWEGGREDGKVESVPATFRLIYLIGWKEGERQQQPEQRGTGQVNLKDVLGGGGLGPGQ